MKRDRELLPRRVMLTPELGVREVVSEFSSVDMSEGQGPVLD